MEKDTIREDGEAQAQVDIWKYVFGFVDMAAVKCAIQLGIPDALESQGGAMTLSDLSSALGCSPSLLHRIMRFLVHRKILKQGPAGYLQTPLSRLLMKNGDKSMADLVLLESHPALLTPWHALSAHARANGGAPSEPLNNHSFMGCSCDHPRINAEPPVALSAHAQADGGGAPFESAHGEDIWKFAAEDPAFRKLIDDAMACGARVAVPAVIEGCPEVFDGLESVVDVGGGNGTALRMLVKAFPWVRGINFDLPDVVSLAPDCAEVGHVGGNMFASVPKADAAYMMWVLHDWGDDECIQILSNCRKAIPKDKGKVIIVEAVIDEEHNNNKLEYAKLMLDLGMMAHTNKGKERTAKKWAYVLSQSGFSRHAIHPIKAVQSVIVAYP